MRIPKFRAYIKQSNEILNVESIDFENKLLVCNTFDKYYFSYEFHQIELMQYIGLNDKNNKEIYEGDIVKYEDIGFGFYTDDTNDYSSINQYKTLLIEYEQKHYNRIIEPIGFHVPYGELEIIGNIYQNSDLLDNE